MAEIVKDKAKARVEITVPRGWQELTQTQLMGYLRLMAHGYHVAAVKIMCFFDWGKIEVIGAAWHGGPSLMKCKGVVFQATSAEVASMAQALDWIETPPAVPVQMSRLCRRNGPRPDFQGEPFRNFIFCDNLWQGYILSKDEGMLDRLATAIYGIPQRKWPLAQWERLAVAFYWASLKAYFANRWPEFYSGASDSGGSLAGNSLTADRVEDAMNAQIRALTKGDVTKEEQVLDLDTWRAMAELNAQAREYRELKEMTRKNGK